MTTAGLESITVATAGILEPLEGAGTRFTPLLQSSEYAMPMDVQRFAMLRDPQELLRDLAPTGERYALAARIDGPAQSAFPDGIEGQKDGLKAAERINLIVVADSDLLADRMWVQVQDFFGQRVPQPFADNAGFAINALDNLAGSDALISVRSRGRYSRPFVVVENLQRQAEVRFREQEEILNQRLAQTEQRLAELQPGDGPEQALELSPEQQATLQQFHAGEAGDPQAAARGALPAQRRHRGAGAQPEVRQYRPGAAVADAGGDRSVAAAPAAHGLSLLTGGRPLARKPPTAPQLPLACLAPQGACLRLPTLRCLAPARRLSCNASRYGFCCSPCWLGGLLAWLPRGDEVAAPGRAATAAAGAGRATGEGAGAGDPSWRAAEDPHRSREGGWVVPDKAGYPAAAGEVDRLLRALGGGAQGRGQDPQPGQPRAPRPGRALARAATRLTLEGLGRAPLVLLIGQASGRAANWCGWPGDEQVWLVDQPLALVDNELAWLDRRISAIPFAEVREVAVRHADGERLDAWREVAEQFNLTLRQLPAGRRLA